VDTLSDVLRAVRLTGAVFFDVDASEPWVASTPSGDAIVRKMFPDADHLIPYHVITHGSCWGAVDGEPPVHASTGDIIVFPHGDAHTLSSAPGMRGTPDLTLYRRPGEGQLPFSVTMGSSHADPASRLWISGMRRHAVQSASGSASENASRRRSVERSDRNVRAVRDRGSESATARQ